MNKKHLVVLCVLVVMMGFWWHMTHHGVNAENLLQRTELSGTSFTYSWKDGSLFEGGISDICVVFRGDATASLKLGDDAPVNINITPERYRELVQSVATNNFSKIRVKRRWGVYAADIGQYKMILKDGIRKTIIHADAKHYLTDSESFQRITKVVYSFEKEFGQPLDYGPFGTAGVPDRTEIVAGAILMVLILCVGVFLKKRISGK